MTLQCRRKLANSIGYRQADSIGKTFPVLKLPVIALNNKTPSHIPTPSTQTHLLVLPMEALSLITPHIFM